MIKELNNHIIERENRIADIRDVLRGFAVPDDDFIFVLDPDYQDECRPYLEEIKTLTTANQAAAKAIEYATGLHNDLSNAGLIKSLIVMENEDPVTSIHEGIRRKVQRRQLCLSTLESLYTFNRVTCKSEIPVHNTDKAQELEAEIQAIPGEMATMQQASDAATEHIDSLPCPQITGNLPCRKSQVIINSVIKPVPETTLPAGIRFAPPQKKKPFPERTRQGMDSGAERVSGFVISVDEVSDPAPEY
jgi:hypothetical protein